MQQALDWLSRETTGTGCGLAINRILMLVKGDASHVADFMRLDGQRHVLAAGQLHSDTALRAAICLLLHWVMKLDTSAIFELEPVYSWMKSGDDIVGQLGCLVLTSFFRNAVSADRRVRTCTD